MNKYSVLSTFCLGIFIVLLSLVFKGISFGDFGKTVIITMFLLPLAGVVFGIKAKQGTGKWILIALNIITLISIGYLALLSGMGEA